MNNINDLMNIYQQMVQAPDRIQFLKKQFGIDLPQNINNPYDLIQYCMNRGMFNQTQVNNAMQMRNNPMIKKIFGL